MSFRLKTAKGYIFDFNGTLILDENENREAWKETVRKMRGTPQSDEEFQLLNGRTDRETVLYFIPDADESTIEYWINEKETLYKKLCMDNGLSLAEGAEDFLSYLSATSVPMAIASSAPKINMDWYIPEYGLRRFFPEPLIIAGRTDIPSKPDSAIFRLAIEELGVRAEQTIIFEDSASGVKAALGSGAKLVIRIKEPGLESIRDPRVIEISSFEEITAE